MKSFESEIGAAGAKAAERKYIEQAGGSEKPAEGVIDALGVPELSLESSQDERDRLSKARLRTTGSLNELRVSEEALRAGGVERGVNPERSEQDRTPAKEYFATNEQSPLIESNELAQMRAKDPALADQYKALKSAYVSQQADIMNLEQQASLQKDATLNAAQLKVLEGFKRELKTLEGKMEEIRRGL